MKCRGVQVISYEIDALFLRLNQNVTTDLSFEYTHIAREIGTEPI